MTMCFRVTLVKLVAGKFSGEKRIIVVRHLACRELPYKVSEEKGLM
jgi:hypothetical protein